MYMKIFHSEETSQSKCDSYEQSNEKIETNGHQNKIVMNLSLFLYDQDSIPFQK